MFSAVVGVGKGEEIEKGRCSAKKVLTAMSMGRKWSVLGTNGIPLHGFFSSVPFFAGVSSSVTGLRTRADGVFVSGAAAAAVVVAAGRRLLLPLFEGLLELLLYARGVREIEGMVEGAVVSRRTIRRRMGSIVVLVRECKEPLPSWTATACSKLVSQKGFVFLAKNRRFDHNIFTGSDL